MNKTTFKISFEEIEPALNFFGLFRMKNSPSLMEKGISSEFTKASMRAGYFKLYNVGKLNYDFDFLLSDESYFQFEIEDDRKIRYAYFQNPIDFISYEEFVLEQTDSLEMTVEEIGDELREEYEQFLGERESRNNFCTFRYDYDKRGHRELVHSVSHMHVGHDNDIRFPINKPISPFLFVLFTIKHAYHDLWKTKSLTELEQLRMMLIKSRQGEESMVSPIWNESEKLEIFFC